jgi:hypothetical protein
VTPAKALSVTPAASERDPQEIDRNTRAPIEPQLNQSAQRRKPASYRPCSTKRSRRSKADIDAIKQAIIKVVGEDPPMTVRQVFYQLVARSAIEKTEAEYRVRSSD